MDEQLPDLAELTDLVLQTRLAMLRSSLTKVCNAIAVLENARQQGMPVSEESRLSTLAAAVRTAEAGLRELVGDIPDAAAQAEAIRILDDMARQRKAAVSPAAAEIPGQRLPALGDTSVGNDLGDYARDLLGDLDEIEAKIDVATGQPAAEARELMDDAWRDYQAALTCCHEIFAEYIELMSGVLLRDAGLDEDLCRIADALIRKWPMADYSWASLSIPAEDERPAMSTAQLVRLGFPEWSIWSLPLAAREYGHIFARKRERVRTDVQEALARHVATEAELCSWTADVFATTVLGSAYPWAAILLRAEPSAADDQARVAVMLHTLELMSPPDEFYRPMARAWQTATDGQFSLSEGQKDFVRKVKSRIRVEFRRWQDANDLADLLRSDAEPEQIASSVADHGLANVLVAAWRVRIDRATTFAEESRPEEPAEHRNARRKAYADDLKTLASRVRDVCVAVIDRRGPATTASVLPEASRPSLLPSVPGGLIAGPDKSLADGGTRP
jgi:hypothetical protein